VLTDRTTILRVRQAVSEPKINRYCHRGTNDWAFGFMRDYLAALCRWRSREYAGIDGD